jgi:hypothetical protein
MQNIKSTQGNILVTVLIILMILSVTTLYSARESLWAAKVSHVEKTSLALDMYIPATLLKVEKLINQLPLEIIPQQPEHCFSPCVVFAKEGNHYLEQDLSLMPAAYFISWTDVEGWVILEYLGDDFFRSSFLLTQNLDAQLHMQANWKKTTLRSNILSLR